jgi:recombinational DNA repair ATPase RecF
LLDPPPLLLLDDVLSELDLARRRALAELLVGKGQALISATHATALPLDPSQVVEVSHGSAR